MKAMQIFEIMSMLRLKNSAHVDPFAWHVFHEIEIE